MFYNIWLFSLKIIHYKKYVKCHFVVSHLLLNLAAKKLTT